MLRRLFLSFFFILLTNPISWAGVSKDIAYGSLPEQILDIYTPITACPQGGCPVLLWVHGGGWRMGSKNMDSGEELGAEWSARGVTVVAINYRLTPAVQHPAHVDDVARSIAWTKAHIQSYGGNPDRLFLIGHSAGAHLVALVGINPIYLEAYGLSPETALAGVFPIDGAAYDLLRRRQNGRWVQNLITNAFGTNETVLTEASPLSVVKNAGRGAHYPPFIIAAAKQREEASKQTIELVSLLQRQGGYADYMIVDYATERTEMGAHRAINQDLRNFKHAMTQRLYQQVTGHRPE